MRRRKRRRERRRRGGVALKKEDPTKDGGGLIRELIFLRPLRAKGYMAKGRKLCKTRLKLKSSSFLAEGYVDKGFIRKGT